MKPKYIHLRAHNVASANPNDIEATGGVTIAYITIPAENKVFWSVARCHPKDNFNKALGRIKALGRLKQSDVNFVTYSSDIPQNKDVVNHLKEMVYFELESRNPDVRFWLY